MSCLQVSFLVNGNIDKPILEHDDLKGNKLEVKLEEQHLKKSLGKKVRLSSPSKHPKKVHSKPYTVHSKS